MIGDEMVDVYDRRGKGGKRITEEGSQSGNQRGEKIS